MSRNCKGAAPSWPRLNEGLEGEIAERIRMEEALRRSETLLRNVFESIPDLLTVHDRDFNIIMSNWHGLGESVPEAERSRPHKCHQIYLHRDRPCEPCHACRFSPLASPCAWKSSIPLITASGKSWPTRYGISPARSS